MTVLVAIECPHCQSTEVTKYGRSPVGKQRYRCQNENCPYHTFVLTQTYPARNRELKQQFGNSGEAGSATVFFTVL